MQNSIAIEFLDETGPVKVTFTISDRIDSDHVSASVTFSAKGLQPVDPRGGVVAINGQPMTAKKLQKQGFWYPLDIQKSDRYQLNVKRSRNTFESVYTILPRKFIPKLPANVSRSQDIVIPYEGPVISKTERLFITLGSMESEEAGQLWEITPKSKVDGNQIIIVSKELEKAKQGSANLYVGLSSFQQPVGSLNKLTYAVGKAMIVNILD